MMKKFDDMFSHYGTCVSLTDARMEELPQHRALQVCTQCVVSQKSYDRYDLHVFKDMILIMSVN